MNWILIDIDDVLADFLTTWLEVYNADYNDNLTVGDIRSWDTSAYVKPECGKKIYDYLNDPNLYYGVQPIEGALEGVNKLRDMGLPLLFVTSFDVSGAKFKWLKEHGFTNNINEYAVCTNKNIIKASVMIDDRPKNIEEFDGTGILYRQPHNEYFKWDNDARSWKEITDAFEDMYKKVLGVRI